MAFDRFKRLTCIISKILSLKQSLNQMICLMVILQYLIMIKLIESLQQSPEQLKELIKKNMNNESMIELTSNPQVIIATGIELQEQQQVPFFIKNVFGMVRQPIKSQLDILKQYVRINNQQNIKVLAIRAINKAEAVQMQHLEEIFVSIKKLMDEGNYFDVKLMIKELYNKQVSPCISLLHLIVENQEKGHWANQKYQINILNSFKQAFAAIQQHHNSQKIYFEILMKLLKPTLNTIDQFSFIASLIKLSIDHPTQVKYIIIQWQKDSKQNIPNLIINQSIFAYFTSLFDHKLYFMSSFDNEDNLKELINLCEALYQLISQDFKFQELGFISLFSISKWINLTISQQSIYKCIAFIRQSYFRRADLISQIIIHCFHKQFISQNFILSNNFQNLMDTLTLKQQKYLIFKLDQTLSQQKKSYIVNQVLKGESQLKGLALFFITTTKFSQDEQNLINQFRQNQTDRFYFIQDQINNSRYNSLQKQIKTFRQKNYFQLVMNLGCLSVKESTNFFSRLRYFKDLFINDYFSQEFWVCHENLQSFWASRQGYEQKIDIVYDFLKEEKIINLSAVLLLTQLLKIKIYSSNNLILSEKEGHLLSIYLQFCQKIIDDEVFISNISIILQFYSFVSQLNVNEQISQMFKLFLNQSKRQQLEGQNYSELNYFFDSIAINIYKEDIAVQKIECLAYFKNHQLITSPLSNLRKIYKLYSKYNIIQKVEWDELKLYQQSRKMIISECQNQYLQKNIKKICDSFVFKSPLFKEQIVALNYISHSPQQNYYFKNHYPTFINLQYIKLYTDVAQKLNNQHINSSIYQNTLKLLTEIYGGDTFSHSATFYKSLIKSKIVHAFLSKSILERFGDKQLQIIVLECLKITEKDNYPLLRQYIQVPLCRAFIILTTRNPNHKIRMQLIDKMKVNVNIGVPIILTLGYELISTLKNKKMDQSSKQIYKIHELLVKFISCHTAYLRAICQYYLYLYLDLVETKDQFLENLHTFWKEDKDSQKILSNVSMVIDGFAEAVQNQSQFLGFERVEEYPTNRLKLQFYGSVCKYYSEYILNEFNEEQFEHKQVFAALNESATNRYNELKILYLAELEKYSTKPLERTLKSNFQKKVKQIFQKPIVKIEKQPKPLKIRKGKQKDKRQKAPLKIAQAPQKKEQQNNPTITSGFVLLSQISCLSQWSRKNIEPKVIVIATLLQKVHNFGHILRTLHKNNALLVVPSIQPLLHEECKQLVPQNCDVPIVQIKPRDLQHFITLMKSLGYPLVALEQCSRSESVEKTGFPDKFMILLGNERIGAPASLLSQGDFLVQIPQIGKIRSLNVHVSMVICLWEYLSKQ